MKRQLPCFRFRAASVLTAIFILPLLLSSCKFDHTTLITEVPAALPVRPNIKKFVIANRSESYANELVPDALPLLGLFDHIDTWKHYSPHEALNGLQKELTNLSYSTAISTINNQVRFSDSINLAIPLDWQTVALLVGDSENTVLVVLEAYYAESEISTTKDVSKKDGEKIVQFSGSASTTVYTKWRIYDLKNHWISEVFYSNRSESHTSSGKESRSAAEEALPAYELTVKDLSNAAGRYVARALFPGTVALPRKFYRGTPDLPMLSKPYKLAKDGHWEEAVAIWTKQAEDANRALAARACYNLAYASERNKEFELALKWAKRSAELGDPQAKKYVSALESRIENAQALAAQQE
jgi:hypothetical protein